MEKVGDGVVEDLLCCLSRRENSLLSKPGALDTSSNWDWDFLRQSRVSHPVMISPQTPKQVKLMPWEG